MASFTFSVAIVWFGAIVASFSHLVMQRLPGLLGWRADEKSGISLCSPSCCDGCGTRIRWPYLLPLFGCFLSLGRCFACGMRISLWHLILEWGSGLACLGIINWFGWNGHGLAACVLWQILVFLAGIDWRECWLPSVVTYPLFWGGLLFSPFELDWALRAWGGFAGFSLASFSMVVAGRWRGVNAWAGGDVALCAAAGVWLGLMRLPVFLLLASILFIVIAWPARRRGQLFIPMGPALAAAFFITLFLPSSA
ncbi:prepilin peptidase [Chromobacterium amazonense]|uniref:prepilin peptidase n=1 Tax=Chromobacterium amazonense TaxID=1382803 RepID=UPI003F7A7454